TRKVLREGGLSGRDRNEGADGAAQGGRYLAEEVPVVITKSVVGKDEGHLLANVLENPSGHRRDLGPHVGDARLEHVAIELARGHVIALAHHEVGDLELSRPGSRGNDDVRKERAEDEVDLVMGGELLDDLGAPLRICSVVLGNDLYGPPCDAAFLVNELHG